MAELLAPAGTFDKMVAAFNYGADAVYFAGKRFGLRAFAGNFDDEEIEKAVEYAHARGKKVYITINIIAHDSNFEGLEEYLHFLKKRVWMLLLWQMLALQCLLSNTQI